MIRAAGGIVIRDQPGHGPEVLVVHRPAYGDWSFPKGKVDPGETLQEAAVREVREETGFRCRVVDHIGDTEYRDADGQRKTVTYWLMTIDDGSFAANPEVDRIEWLPPHLAAERLTYDRDQDLLLNVEFPLD